MASAVNWSVLPFKDVHKFTYIQISTFKFEATVLLWKKNMYWCMNWSNNSTSAFVQLLCLCRHWKTLFFKESRWKALLLKILCRASRLTFMETVTIQDIWNGLRAGPMRFERSKARSWAGSGVWLLQDTTGLYPDRLRVASGSFRMAWNMKENRTTLHFHFT